MNQLDVPVIGAKWAIGSTAMLHTAVGALSIGFAFVVTVLQIVAYKKKERGYDLLAKRVQLWHVCIYNIGTIVAIGLVFCLSGLFPQFWSQIFHHLFWSMIVEEFLFLLLATTLTFHYFFWEYMWGHKRLHIFLGALLNPLFLLQFYIINGMGAFMLTPGMQEAEADLTRGFMGWSTKAFYNPSFLMLTFHRTFANFSYAGYIVAGICGIYLYFVKNDKIKKFFENGGRLSFYAAFLCFISIPIIGYFYAVVLKYHASEAYVNLMWGRGDVVAGGIDWWWVKHICVIGMLGLSLGYFHKTSKTSTSSLPKIMIYSVAIFYAMYYIGMGAVMTWKFAFWMVGFGIFFTFLATHLISYHTGSPRAVFLLVGILSFLTVMLGGYAREASRPRFIKRISHYDDVYVPKQRQKYLMVDIDTTLIPAATRKEAPTTPVLLIRERCSGCHTLERVQNYEVTDHWETVIRQMHAYGLRITNEEIKIIADYLDSKQPY